MEKYKKKLTEYEDKLKQKYSDFSYDAEADELFRLQREQLERNQSDGVSDVLARYAANTGMGGSSAAMSAAQQTASKYNSMIADALTAAEEKAYSRWAAEKADLESMIAATRAEALGEAEKRFELGDLSGYQGLGYDTTTYEAQLAAAEAEKAAAAAQADYQNKLAEAQARAQYGDLSGLKALGYDTSAYEAKLAREAAEAEAKIAQTQQKTSSAEQKSTVKRGGNGMTEEEYKAEVNRIYGQINTLEKYKDDTNLKRIKLLYSDLDRLNKSYFSTPRDYSDDEIAEILTDLELTDYKVVSYPQYLALVKYFEAEGGEDYLKKKGITYSKSY